MVKKSVTVLIPAYNEEKMLEKSILEQYAYMKSIKKKSLIGSFEMIICVNASTDKTEEISARLSKKYKEVSYFHIKERGMGIALTEGMKKAKKDIITFTDADYECLLDFLEQAVHLMKDYQVLSCSRYTKKEQHGSSMLRSFLSRGFREFFRLMFKYKFTEAGTVKVFRSDAAKLLIPHLNGYLGNWQMDVLYYSLKYNLRIKEIPLNIRFTRPASEAKVNVLKETWSFFCTGLKYGIKIHLGI